MRIRFELSTGDGTVFAFEPLRRDKRTGRLDLPFAVRTEHSHVQGHIYLKSPKEPLTIFVAAHGGNIRFPGRGRWRSPRRPNRYCAPPGDPRDETSEPAGFHPDDATGEVLGHRV